MSKSICKSSRNIDPWKRKPGFSTYYDIGVLVSKEMKPYATLEEVGKRFGISKQNAYTETVVALGKLCYALRQIRRKEVKP